VEVPTLQVGTRDRGEMMATLAGVVLVTKMPGAVATKVVMTSGAAEEIKQIPGDSSPTSSSSRTTQDGGAKSGELFSSLN